MEILLLMLLLQLKHYWADFGIQTYTQTVRKGVYGDLLGLSHTLDHIILSLVALMVFNCFYPVSALTILLYSTVEGVIHYHIDWFKVRFGTKNMQSGLFWNQFGLDQLAHQLTYIGMIYLMLVD
jgi:hypothetical protein